MKTLLVVPYMLVMVLLGSVATAETSDWQALKALPLETQIKVTLKKGRGVDHCVFKVATDEQLTCVVERHGPTPLLFSRCNVRAVYLSPEHHHAGGFPLAAVGAAISVPVVIVGVFAGPVPILVGAGVLGGTYLAGRHFAHGKLVYQSPHHAGLRPGGVGDVELKGLPQHPSKERK